MIHPDGTGAERARTAAHRLAEALGLAIRVDGDGLVVDGPGFLYMTEALSPWLSVEARLRREAEARLPAGAAVAAAAFRVAELGLRDAEGMAAAAEVVLRAARGRADEARAAREAALRELRRQSEGLDGPARLALGALADGPP